MPTTTPGPPGRATRCWTLVGAAGAIDVAVTADDEDELGAVLPALEQLVGRPVDGLWDGTSRLPGRTRLRAPQLAHGAVLGLGRPGPGTARGSALELHVVAGPEAGRTLPLGSGRHLLGRGSGATVALEDPDVSRCHVAVTVGGGRITVADLGSTNGSRVADEVLTTEPRAWTAGAVLRLGSTALTVRSTAGPAAAVTPGTGGRAVLRPAPRLDRPPAGERAGVRPPVVEVVFPRPPETVHRRRLPWVAVALPAVAGVLMAWLLDAPTFLFFALLGPAVAVGTWLGDRWSGRRGARRAGAEHEAERAAAEARLAVAVRSAVTAADAAHPDPAALATAARRRTGPLWSRTGADGDALTVRLGTGPGDTGVTRVDGSGARVPQAARHLPVVLDLAGGGGLTVVGPAECTGGVLRSVVCQLAVLLPPGWWQLLLLCTAEGAGSWRWARWLPHLDPAAVHLAADPPGAPGDDGLVAALTELAAGHRAAAAPLPAAAPADHRPRTVVLVDRPVGPRLAAALRGARGAGVVVLTRGASPAAAPVVTDTVLELGGETGTAGRLSRRGVADVTVEVVDRVPVPTAARVARDLAGLRSGPASGTVPRAVRLLDLPSPGVRILDDGTLAGAWSARRDRLRTVLGRSAEGPVVIDLCADGPHALVAGTTGSGKSELLQSLVAGLAMAHPPGHCSFLLVDYKGGAAFGDAADLPHTVGLLTDLDGQSTARALRSLTAELTRRERILASRRVADLADLPAEVELARLVIVVDEFATLADELPSFVPGLVSIAQRGRSLGVHLVLATQRPAGVVSPEIRANCSLRICLRTTDGSDSLDVVGTPDAAALPVDLPGRAYLRTGNRPPVAVQVARVAVHPPAVRTVAAGPRGTTPPAVHRWAWPAPSALPPEAASAETDLARVCRLLAGHARATGAGVPHPPWQPPLPDQVQLTDRGAAAAGPGAAGTVTIVERADRERPTRLVLGLVDVPDRQSRRALELDLDAGGTWLAVGGPRSGRSTLLRTVLREALSRLPADDLHVHLVEAGGGSLAAELAGLPHAGTVVSGADRFRTARLVERLGEEIAARRAGARRAGAPRLLLLVDGVEELSAHLDEALPGTGSATLERLLRDGPAAGLTSVVTADRAVPGGRLAALAGHRLVLPLADRADYAVAGVAPGAVPARRPPGRALVGEDGLECQLAVPRAPGAALTTPPRPGRAPLTIPALPPDPVLPLSTRAPAADAATALVLAVGPGGDEGHPIAVDLRRTGGLLVAGPPGSGRTTALDAFAEDLAHRGAQVLRLGGRRADGPGRPSLPTADGGMQGAAALEAWLRGLQDAPGVLLLDDVPAPAELPVLEVLSRPGVRVALVAAGQAADLATHYQGPVAALRRARTGLLLQPGPGDADLLGVRLPRLPVPARPGSGWLVEGGSVHRVQVARRSAAVASG